MSLRNWLSRRPETPAANAPAKQDSILDLLNRLMGNHDFLGIGNLMLEVLMRPGQSSRPDEDLQTITACVRTVFAARYDIPEDLTYGCPYRDRHIAHHDRGSWDKDHFIQLIIVAYALGATRVNLPPPHDKLVSYYRTTASEQHREIERVAQEFKKHPKPPPPPQSPAEVSRLFEAVKRGELTLEEAEAEIAHRMNGSPFKSSRKIDPR